MLLAIHDWVDLAPFNDVHATRSTSTLFGLAFAWLLNCGTMAVALIGTVWYGDGVLPCWFARYLVITYAFFCFGAFMYWYRPMIFGAADWHKESFKQEYAHTHHVIRGTFQEVRPNTLHLLIHLLIIVSAILAVVKAKAFFSPYINSYKRFKGCRMLRYNLYDLADSM